MPLFPLSFAQRAIARGIEAWCKVEGIRTSAATLVSFGTSVHAGSTTFLLNLGDTDVLIESERVLVRMPHRIAEYDYAPNEPVTDVVAAVTKTLETG
jgi:hypothetical protein